mmetsp:Transcript_39481/g.91665  ORF Transcript_39481/g.91665 Transcript_39481/m.91665 type:complete len:159 (+) Transcript_39481:67-543(+)
MLPQEDGAVLAQGCAETARGAATIDGRSAAEVIKAPKATPKRRVSFGTVSHIEPDGRASSSSSSSRHQRKSHKSRSWTSPWTEASGNESSESAESGESSESGDSPEAMDDACAGTARWQEAVDRRRSRRSAAPHLGPIVEATPPSLQMSGLWRRRQLV